MEIFGFQISKKDKPSDLEKVVSFAVPSNDDGASIVTTQTGGAGGHFGTVFDLDTKATTEADLISRYRETAMYPDCDSAIEEVCAEAISAEDDEEVVKLNLEDVELSPNVKSIIEEEFEEIQKLLDFDSKSHDIFKRWYIDGRIVYHKVINTKQPKLGIQELRYIDPRKIRKVREVKKVKDQNTGVETIINQDEYFVYSERGLAKTSNYSDVGQTLNAVKISVDAVAFCTSGLIDLDKNMILSHIHKAVKPTNMLKLAEDAMLIYRLSRAPERRVFYVDVGNLQNAKADQYLKNVMNRFRNKIVYDAATGEVRDDRKHMSMMEDFWLPRREGGKGTEVQTLEGAQNLGVTEDIQYYQTKLFQALSVPVSRLQASSPMNFGRQMEITRDELKFAKFIGRLRRRFTELFDDLLKTQLILKGVMTEDDWLQIVKPKLKYVFTSDIYWAEAKAIENLRNQVDILTAMDPFVGIYYSKEYVKKTVLKQTDEEIEEIGQQIEAEKPDLLQHAAFQGQLATAQEPEMVSGQPPQ